MSAHPNLGLSWWMAGYYGRQPVNLSVSISQWKKCFADTIRHGLSHGCILHDHQTHMLSFKTIPFPIWADQLNYFMDRVQRKQIRLRRTAGHCVCYQWREVGDIKLPILSWSLSHSMILLWFYWDVWYASVIRLLVKDIIQPSILTLLKWMDVSGQHNANGRMLCSG